eukprot:PhM_4_TR10778/c0_g1_i1/m.60405/K16465/CETN1; centrin-1
MALTREQIKSAFDLFDCDQSGEIDVQEVELVLRGIGFADLSRQEVTAMIKAMDTDGSGLIRYEEFEKLVTKKLADAGTPEEIWKAFKLFESSGKGRIMFDDLKRAAAVDKSVTDDQLHAVMKYACADPARGITYEEWKHVMNTVRAPSKRVRMDAGNSGSSSAMMH